MAPHPVVNKPGDCALSDEPACIVTSVDVSNMGRTTTTDSNVGEQAQNIAAGSSRSTSRGSSSATSKLEDSEQVPMNIFAPAKAALGIDKESARVAEKNWAADPLFCKESVDGAVGHEQGTCKPCVFFHTKGCDSGSTCSFCHLCPEGEKLKRRKERLMESRERHRIQQAAQNAIAKANKIAEAEAEAKAAAEAEAAFALESQAAQEMCRATLWQQHMNWEQHLMYSTEMCRATLWQQHMSWEQSHQQAQWHDAASWHQSQREEWYNY